MKRNSVSSNLGRREGATATRMARMTPSLGDPYQELEERVLAVPMSATARGMFFNDLLKRAPTLESPRARYIPFTSYPLRELMQLMLATCRTCFPTLPPHEALRQVGQTAYSAFASSLAGTALFGITQLEYLRILQLAPKGYELSISPCEVTIEVRAEGSAVARLRDVWSFAESYHRGLWEAAMKALHVRGVVDVEVLNRSAVDFHLTWDPTSASRAR